jgi:hypothetical protein
MFRTGFVAMVLGAVAVFGLGHATAASSVKPSNTSRPTVSGTAERGRTLTASTGSWSGTPPITFDFQWQRCSSAGTNCALISGATSQTYTIVLPDVGNRLRVVVNARNADGSAQAASSTTAIVKDAPQNAPQNTARPGISGTEREGSTLTVGNGTWTGSQPMTFSYQWQRCDTNGGACVVISGATGKAYTLVAADVGKRHRATVTATNAYGAASVVSSASSTVAAAPATAPRNTVPPAVSGTSTEGGTLTASPGTWNGTLPIAYSFQWLRCDAGGGNCAAISGATGQTYVATGADVGLTLRVAVTGRNSAGSSTVQSLASGRIGDSGSGTIKLPSGKNSVAASTVELPTRLVIDQVRWSPNPVRSRDTVVTGRIHVSDTRGNAVRESRVLLTGLPYGWITRTPEVTTGVDGWATVQFRLTANAPRRGALVMFLRARKLGDNVLAGVSTRRLVQMSIRL